jgi:hypothetical protein
MAEHDVARVAAIRTESSQDRGVGGEQGLVGWAGNAPIQGLFTPRDRRDRVTQP